MTLAQEPFDVGELIMHHAADAYELDFTPFFKWHYGQFLPDMHVAGITFNLTPSKHVFFMLLSATLVFLTMWLAGRSLEKQRATEKAPKGFANAMEAFVLISTRTTLRATRRPVGS